MCTQYLILLSVCVILCIGCDTLTAVSSVTHKKKSLPSEAEMMHIRLDLEHDQPEKSVRLTILTNNQLKDEIIPVLATRTNQAFIACPKAYGKSLGVQMEIPAYTSTMATHESKETPQMKLKALENDSIVQCIINTFDKKWDTSFDQGSQSLYVRIEPLIKDKKGPVNP